MEIIIKEQPTPTSSSFELFAKPDLELLKETKEVTISINKVTKTRLSTNLTFGKYRVGVNLAKEGFKTAYKEDYSYFSGEVKRSNYFVVSKKQNKEVYFEYLKAIMKDIIGSYFNLKLDEVTVIVHCSRIFED